MAINTYRMKVAILCLLVLAHIGYAAFVNKPGHYTVDEGVYHMMVKALAEEGSLAVRNGFEETPSAELVYALLRVDNRDPAAPHLVPQYPAIYAVIAVPFYWLGGFHGLFLINLLAFLGSVWMTMAIARRLSDDPNVALNSALILVLGTYTWEYVHGVWPHILSMFLVSAAVLAGLSALQETRPGRAAAMTALAGLIIGVGAGVRYDVVLVGPAIALPFLFASPTRIAPVLAMAGGMLPGIGALALTNHAKFGVLSPFSYGSGLSGSVSVGNYVPLLIAACAATGLVWAATRESSLGHLRRRPAMLAGGGIAILLALVLVPQIREVLIRLLQGSWELVVDLRYRPDIKEWGVSRTPTGGLAYGISLKKALLQNCPWLIMIGLPLGAWLKKRDGGHAMLFLAIGAFIALYGYQRWHGGLSLNMRYFVPFLPFAAILAAEAWRSMAMESPRGRTQTVTAAGLASALVWIPLIFHDPTLGVEPVLLNVPLAIAFALGILLLLRLTPAGPAARLSNSAAMLVATIALAWSASVTIAYDAPRSTATRVANHNIGTKVRSVIRPDAIVFTRYANRVSALIDDDVPLAFPRNDDFADFKRLLDMHLDEGRPVYLAFNDEYWKYIEANGLLNGLKVHQLFEDVDLRFAEVRRSRSASDRH